MSRPPNKNFAVQHTPLGITDADLQAAKDAQALLLALSIHFSRHAPDHPAFYAVNRALREVQCAIDHVRESLKDGV